MTNLNTLRINDQWISHDVDTRTDETVFTNESGDTIMSVDCHGYAYYSVNGGVFPFGKFYLGNNDLWYFKYSNDDVIIQTGNASLIKAEMKVFKQLVQENHLQLSIRSV